MLASVVHAANGAGGVLVLARTRWRLIGRDRYLLCAVALPLMAGLGLLGIGVHELAWIPLSAAALAAMHWTRARWAALSWLLVASVPALALLGPDLLREASFHGFLSAAVPLSVITGVVLAYPVYVIQRWPTRRVADRVGARTLVLILAGSAIVATLAMLLPAPPCEPSSYSAYGLSCEIIPRP